VNTASKLFRGVGGALAILATLAILNRVEVAKAEETYGSWAVSLADDKSSVFAGTLNDSGGVLAEFCYPEKGSCIWTIGMSSSCEEGHEYPVLANSDASSAQLQVKCNGQIQDGKYSYAFTNFDDIDRIVKSSTRVGFAVPLQSDLFTVVRFSLTGSTSAVQRMRDVANTMNVGGKKKNGTGTQDQTI
jgi:hypothetical protein